MSNYLWCVLIADFPAIFTHMVLSLGCFLSLGSIHPFRCPQIPLHPFLAPLFRIGCPFRVSVGTRKYRFPENGTSGYPISGTTDTLKGHPIPGTTDTLLGHPTAIVSAIDQPLSFLAKGVQEGTTKSVTAITPPNMVGDENKGNKIVHQ